MITEVQIATRNTHPGSAVFEAIDEAEEVFEDGGHTILSIALYREASADFSFPGMTFSDETEWVCEMTVSP